MKFWILNQKWTRGFIASHIIGYGTAFFQTLWIVHEIRKGIKKILKVLGQQ